MPNSTIAVPSSWIEMRLTWPTSTPAMRTKLPLSSPDTLLNCARYGFSSPKRRSAKIANIAISPSVHTTMKIVNRQMAPARFSLIALASPPASRRRCRFSRERRGRCRLQLRRRWDDERLGSRWRGPWFARGAGRRRRRQARVQRRPVRCVLRSAVGRRTRVRDGAGGRPARIADAGRFGLSSGDREVVGVSRESDSGVGADIEPRSPAGIGNQLAQRPVGGDVGQRSAARLTAGSAFGADDRKVLRKAVLVGAEQRSAVDDQ